MTTEKESGEHQPETEEANYVVELGDYSLKLLSEANGMTLLVSEIGQVFWVKKTKNGERLVALNRGKGEGTTLPGFYTQTQADNWYKDADKRWKKISK